MDWNPDYSNCKNEWISLKDDGTAPVARETVSVELSDNDWLANSSIGQFTICLQPVLSERHIGIDQGRWNFAMVAVDKEIGKPPVLVAAEHFDLQLGERFTASDAVLKLMSVSVDEYENGSDCDRSLETDSVDVDYRRRKEMYASTLLVKKL